MDRAAQRRFLLELTGTATAAGWPHVSPDDWAGVDGMAAQHRLQPLLHAMHGQRTEIPEEIRNTWRAAHRLSAIHALAQRADLIETCAMLERQGFAPVALKGAWLSRHAYPEAAQRPMRDLDLLVPPDQVIPAFNALLENGLRQETPAELTVEEIVRLEKHMPPLTTPRGTRVELHHRLWELDGRLDHASPDEASLTIEPFVTDPDGIRFLCPQEQLAHLIIHAVYSHRLDCGPLIVSDISFLIQKENIDWTLFWSDAAQHGWRNGARLMLELVARYRPETRIDFSADKGPSAPAALLGLAPDLLLQDLDTRHSAGFAAATLSGGTTSLVARLMGRRAAHHTAPAGRGTGGLGGALYWAGSRLVRNVRDLARREVRQQSRQLAALSTWLDQ